MDKTKKTVKLSRKAIFVNHEVFKRFKERAKKDGRTYSVFLERLLNS